MTDQELLKTIHDNVLEINKRLFTEKNSISTQVEMNTGFRQGANKKIWTVGILVIGLFIKEAFTTFAEMFRTKGG